MGASNSVSFEDAFNSWCEATSEMKPKAANDKTLKKILTDSKLYKGKFDTNGVDICFRKFMGNTKEECNFQEFESFVKGPLTEEYKKAGGTEDLMAKIIECSPAAKGPKTQKVDSTTARLTDTSKYTGSHKEMFDADGEVKGTEGREDGSAGIDYEREFDKG